MTPLFRSLALTVATLVGKSPMQETKPAAPPVAAEIKSEALWDGRKIAPFRALDTPPMGKATAASTYLGDNEYILGITVNGESRAYPTRFAWWHHVINDTVGGKPIAITYCSVCNTGIAFSPILAGKTLLIDFYGLYNGVACFCDRESGSVLLQVDGRFVTGSLLGKSLRTLPVLDTTWGQWKALHPDTLVMSPETPFQKVYRAKGAAEPRGYDRFPLPFFRPTVTHTDKRLPPFDKVVAVTVGTKRRAYPVKALAALDGILNDTLDDLPVVVFFDTQTAAATVYAREIDGKSLTFERRKGADGGMRIYDRETGTPWNLAGMGEDGPLRGKSLTPVKSHLSQWYGWVAFFPDTSIYGRSDPPVPGDPFTP